MNSASQAIIAALLMFSLSACAKSTQPLPNKNTNWLEHCESDDECGEALECRCGICTVTCANDSACEVDDRRAVCWHEQSNELADQCAAPSSSGAVCVPPELVPAEDELVNEDCPTSEACATTVADRLFQPAALVVNEDRVYWLEGGWPEPGIVSTRADGALKSMRLSGRDVVTHAADLSPGSQLALDATHAYFTHAMRSKVLSRVPLAGGELEHIYEDQLGHFRGLAVADERVFFIGADAADFHGIYGAPNDSSLYTNPLVAPEPADALMDSLVGSPEGLIAVEEDLYWNDGTSIRRIAMDGGGSAIDLASSNGVTTSDFAGPIVRHGDHLFWLWHDGIGDGGLASVDLAGTEDVQRIVQRDFSIATLAADATHIYWAQAPREVENPLITIVRTDRATRETTTLIAFDGFMYALIALSNDHVFIARGGESEAGRGSDIVRLPK